MAANETTADSIKTIKCTRCRNNKNESLFISKTGGVLKTCAPCRVYKDNSLYMREYRKNTKLKDTRDRKEYMKQYYQKKKNETLTS